MYRSILVPLDGTAFGEHALPLALAAARRTGASLKLVHVHVPEGAWGALEGVPLMGVSLHELGVKRDREYLDALVARLAGAGVEVSAQVLEGSIGRTLAETAREGRVELVVMSTHAHSGLERLWHRGVAAYLTRALTLPILMVHAGDQPPALEADVAVRHVLVPLGGATYSEGVLEHAAALGSAFGARFRLLRVVAPPVEVGYTLLGQDGHVNHFQLDERREEALRYLENVAAALRDHGLEVSVDVAASANAAQCIDDYVEAAAEAGDPVDLIAMETHGLGGAAHLFTPSVVEEVAHGTRVPVLVHHAAPAPAAARDETDDAPHMGWPDHHPTAGPAR